MLEGQVCLVCAAIGFPKSKARGAFVGQGWALYYCGAQHRSEMERIAAFMPSFCRVPFAQPPPSDAESVRETCFACGGVHEKR